MQRTRQKLHCEELQLTKVILTAPSEGTSERGIRDEPFIYYPRSEGGRAFEKPLTPFAAWISTGDCAGGVLNSFDSCCKTGDYTKKAPDAGHCSRFESLS